MVGCEKHLITATLGCKQQFTILLAFETRPFSALGLMVGKTLPEIHWEACSIHDIRINDDHSLSRDRSLLYRPPKRYGQDHRRIVALNIETSLSAV